MLLMNKNPWPLALLRDLAGILAPIFNSKRAVPLQAVVLRGVGAAYVAQWLESEVIANSLINYYLITDDLDHAGYYFLGPLTQNPDALRQALVQKNLTDPNSFIVIHLEAQPISNPREWFESWRLHANLAGLLILAEHKKIAHSAADWLLSAANIGLTPDKGKSFTYPELPENPEYSLFQLYQRPYRIRHPKEEDLAALVNLESLCWPAPIAMSSSKLSNRILNHPKEQLVLLEGEVLEGVVYSQRIESIDLLNQAHGETVEQFYDANGRIIQLLALNVLPELQTQGLGEILLEFMLQWISLQNVETVVGVTRWSQYSAYQDLTPQEYLEAKNHDGQALDPVIEMHKKHGAKVKKLIPHYRPKDVDNRGCGVLVQYDLANRLSEKLKTSDTQKTPTQSIEEMIEAAIKSFVPEDKKSLISRNASLMSLGFDSLNLMKLRDALSNLLKEEIPATFFFQYENTQLIIDYFVESKLKRYYGWFYDVEFRVLPEPRLRAFHPGDLWLIFVDENEQFSKVLIEKLVAKGQGFITVRMGPFFQALSDHDYQLSLGKRDFIELFQAIKDCSIAGVCYLWGMVSEAPKEPDIYFLERFHRQACSGLMYIVQGIHAALFQKTPRLWVITRAEQTRGNVQALLTMPLESLCNVVVVEHPEFKCCRISIDSRDSIENAVQHCFQEFNSLEKQDQVFWLDNKRYGARLIHFRLALDSPPPELKPEGTYVIVGGCGGLGNIGLSVAQWHVEHGARYLILIDPHPLSHESQLIVESFKKGGVSVELHIIDVTQFQKLETIFSQAKIHLPPIKGITHALGQVDDDKLINLDWSRFENVFQYKVPVAWHLHTLSKSLELDHFILFSSLGPLLGPRWRASRVSANAFLDALAHYRASLKLPALAIDWGPWSSIVPATDPIFEANLPLGLNKIDIEQGMAVLSLLYSFPRPEVVVADIDWSKMLRYFSLDSPLLFDMQSELGLRQSEIFLQLQDKPEIQQLQIIENYVIQHLRRILFKPVHMAMDSNLTLKGSGVDDLSMEEFKQNIQYDLGESDHLPAHIFRGDTKISEFAKALLPSVKMLKVERRRSVTPPSTASNVLNEPIAIIGMGCRLPAGANNPEEFWEILHNGVDGISEVPPDRWDINAYYDPDPDAPGKMSTRYGGFIKNVDLFDANFFGIGRREARYIDPQHRLLLETTWHALEHAGIAPNTLAGSKTGVFIGMFTSDYSHLLTQNKNINNIDAYYGTGNAFSAAAGRLSYYFNLRGPSIAVDTACSSSLVAVDLAFEKLRLGECDLAIVGGVNLMLAPYLTINFSHAHMLSPDGRCKTFDEKANGYVRGEGCGVIILKRLSDAKRHNNRILALIRATAVNQDGASQGFTVPNVNAQEEVIKEALKKANLQATDITYLEAHGTGTSLGDPIELRSSGSIYGDGRLPDEKLIVGSLKTNFGHLEAAAGIAGLMKVVLAFQHEMIPKHIHFHKLNPLIDLESIPALIATENIPWTRNEKIRRAAINSFAFSGTNAHAILEEAPLKIKTPPTLENPGFHLISLSAKSEEALADLIKAYQEFFTKNTVESLEDIAYTMNHGRSHLKYRLAFVADSLENCLEKINNYDFKLGKAVKNNPAMVTFEYVPVEGLKIKTLKEGKLCFEIGPLTEWNILLEKLVELYVEGAEIDWKELYESFSYQVVTLPNYPFQSRRFWAECLGNEI